MRHVITFFLSVVLSFPLLADEIVIAVVKGLDYPPYFWRDSQTGRRDGYLPDLHGQLLASLGYSVRYHEYDPRQPESWQLVMKGLNEGSIDVIGGITDLQKTVQGVTPIKAPLFKAQMAIFARKENLQQLSGLQQLKGRVGAFGLYNAPLVLSEDIERYKLQAKSYRQYHEAYQWLINREVDYWVADIFAAKAYLYRFDRPHQVATAGEFFSVYPVYIGMSEKSRHRAIVPALKKQIESIHESGKAQLLLKKHMQRYVHYMERELKTVKAQGT